MTGFVAVLVQYVAFGVVGFTLVYVFTLTVMGMYQTRRAGWTISAQEALIDSPVTTERAALDLFVYFLIPCLNEELVIGQTVRRLIDDQLAACDGTVVVIDDDSDDTTAAVAQEAGGGQVLVHRRVRPLARLGKGEALNSGLQLVRSDVALRGRDPRSVLVCVIDADGQMTPNAVPEVAKVFAADPRVGGAQLVVRIRNRQSLMLRFQDMEFWAMSGVGQLGRIPVGTVSMGGNGQFTRLTALDELGERPWSKSLTEDLDLGISLCLRGWRTSSTPAAYVTQQGLNNVRALIKQRTRWYQGHMMCGRRVLELARSRYLDNWGFFELSMYLAVPWLITLPWSLIQQYLLIQICTGHGLPNQVFASASWSGRIAYLIVWYLISFAPHLFWGMLYWRRSRTVSLGRGLAMAHLMIPWSYVSYFAAWRAVGRILLGRTQWTKTRRVAEPRHAA